MTTTTTSSLSGSRAALFDELSKIAEDAVQPPKKDPSLKRVLKAGALYSLGYAAGHGGAMLLDKGLSHAFKNKYPHWTPDFKKKVLFPLLGLATMGATISAHYTEMKRQKMVEGE